MKATFFQDVSRPGRRQNLFQRVSWSHGFLYVLMALLLSACDDSVNSPQFTASGPFRVAEGSATSIEVGTVVATNAFSYRMTRVLDAAGQDASGTFAIDAATGVITHAGVLDFETSELYRVRVEAANRAGDTAATEVMIIIEDIQDGSRDDPYEVATLEELQSIGLYRPSEAGFCNAYLDALDGTSDGICDGTALTGSDILTHHYVQTRDIDASITRSWSDNTDEGVPELTTDCSDSCQGFRPIAHDIDTGVFSHQGTRFSGSYDGQGYIIEGLMINRQDEDHVGLFGYTARSAVLTSIGLEKAEITGGDRTGALAGVNLGTIRKSYATASVVSGDFNVGGLVGINGQTIKESYATVSVIARSTIVLRTGTGGLVGSTTPLLSTIEQSYAIAKVIIPSGSPPGEDSVGGLVGQNFETIRESYASSVIATNDLEIPGSTTITGTISQSFYNSDTSGQSTADQGEPRTTAQLVCRTAASDDDCPAEDPVSTYSDWDAAIWDFGTVADYPILQGIQREGSADFQHAHIVYGFLSLADTTGNAIDATAASLDIEISLFGETSVTVVLDTNSNAPNAPSRLDYAACTVNSSGDLAMGAILGGTVVSVAATDAMMMSDNDESGALPTASFNVTGGMCGIAFSDVAVGDMATLSVTITRGDYSIVKLFNLVFQG